MPTPEGKIQNDIIQYLRREGCRVGKVKIQGRQIAGRYIFDKDSFRGFPDLVCFQHYNNIYKDREERYTKMYFIECKTPKGILSDEQEHFKWLCELASIPYIVATCVKDVEIITC